MLWFLLFLIGWPLVGASVYLLILRFEEEEADIGSFCAACFLGYLTLPLLLYVYLVDYFEVLAKKIVDWFNSLPKRD